MFGKRKKKINQEKFDDGIAFVVSEIVGKDIRKTYFKGTDLENPKVSDDFEMSLLLLWTFYRMATKHHIDPTKPVLYSFDVLARFGVISKEENVEKLFITALERFGFYDKEFEKYVSSEKGSFVRTSEFTDSVRKYISPKVKRDETNFMDFFTGDVTILSTLTNWMEMFDGIIESLEIEPTPPKSQ